MVLTTTLMLLLGVLLVAAVLGGARSVRGRPRAHARHLLDSQFARGELSIDEYLQHRRLIERA